MTDAAPAAPGTPAPYDAVVLAGGAARRLGGADKPGVRVGGRALLDRVLATRGSGWCRWDRGASRAVCSRFRSRCQS
ncbi:NTP transferase domain-containing protein, partial [Streptomyces eurythermus]|uniref:NTP transferase domain-containing protein n=1 Tax=Streptomyces eurythermus TaxID=42237 RepID=UPI0033F26A18